MHRHVYMYMPTDIYIHTHTTHTHIFFWDKSRGPRPSKFILKGIRKECNLDFCITENNKRGSQRHFLIFLLTNPSTYCLIVHLGNCLYSLPERSKEQAPGIRTRRCFKD